MGHWHIDAIGESLIRIKEILKRLGKEAAIVLSLYGEKDNLNVTIVIFGS